MLRRLRLHAHLQMMVFLVRNGINYRFNNDEPAIRIARDIERQIDDYLRREMGKASVFFNNAPVSYTHLTLPTILRV